MNLQFWKRPQITNSKPTITELTEQELFTKYGVKRCPKCNKNYVRCHNSCPKDYQKKKKLERKQMEYFNCPYCEYKNLSEEIMWYHCTRWHPMLLANLMFEHAEQKGDSVNHV